MTIHHDKKAYGRLKPLSDDMTDDELLAMLGELEEEYGDDDKKEDVDDDAEGEYDRGDI